VRHSLYADFFGKIEDGNKGKKLSEKQTTKL